VYLDGQLLGVYSNTSTNSLNWQVKGGNFCFTAGTLVHTDRGLILIEKIRVGDRVLSQPEETGELAYKRVLRTFSFEDKEVCLEHNPGCAR
jgi:Pretoxin HINT domain